MTALDLEVRNHGLLDLFDREQKIITVSDGFQFTEGAVWNPSQNYLVFSDIAGNRMYRLDPPGTISVYREPSNMANGNYYDRQQREDMRVTHLGHACVLVELDLPVTAPAPARRDLRDRGPRIVRHLDGTLRLDETTLERLETIFPGPGGPAPEAYAW